MNFSRTFTEKPNFEYPCPTCKKGFLIPDQSTFVAKEPKYSSDAKSLEEWEPEWIKYRFSVTCICNHNSCGELAFVTGEGTVEMVYSQENESEYCDYYNISSFIPSPPLCAIPDDTPPAVKLLLERSFSLFWLDPSAAANSLRASLEALLETLKVPNIKLSKNGKEMPLNLHQRLEIWSESQKDFSELCMALKEVGNLGSHGEDVKAQVFIDSLTIYSHVLVELFANDRAKLKELANKITTEIKNKKAKKAKIVAS